MLHLVACTSTVFRMVNNLIQLLTKGEKTLKDAKAQARRGRRWKRVQSAMRSDDA